jgi:AraC-like DNA-binding protein
MKIYRKILHEFNAETPLGVYHDILNKPNNPTPQVHPYYEIGIVLKGRYRHQGAEGRQDLGRGGVWMAGAWEVHSYDILQPPTELAVVEFMPSLIVHFPELKSDPFHAFLPFLQPEIRLELQKRSPESRQRLLETIHRMIREQEQKKRGYRFFLGLELWNLLAEAMREFHPSRRLGPRPGLINRQMQNVIDYVTENLDGRITFTEAARAACLGPSQFSRSFKQIFGLTFFQYVTRCRLAGARQELFQENMNLKLESLARRWGFYDASHFFRAYKKQYGHSPAQERAS